MGKGGRFGKYGEQKRFDRLRQSRSQKSRMIRDFPRDKPFGGFPHPQPEKGSKPKKDRP